VPSVKTGIYRAIRGQVAKLDSLCGLAEFSRRNVVRYVTLSLRRRGVPVVCIDARHAKAALSLQINKTDANDAFGLAQVVRTGWYREVAVKSMDAHTLRMLLVARSRLVSQRQATANTIRGLLKTFGLVVARGSKGLFPVRVREQIAGNPVLIAIIEPLLAVWYAIRDQVMMLDRQMLARARNDNVARRLMTIPGVDVVIALAYTAVIDDPARFRRSVLVGAYLGLTPRRYQSGEVDTTGHISKCGDRRSLRIRCMMTVSLRATATLARRVPIRFASPRPELFNVEARASRWSSTAAAS
jgi:transposase